MENRHGRETGEHCFVVEAWAWTAKEEEIGCGGERIHKFCEGVEENRVRYLAGSGLLPEGGNQDKKAHVSIYCFVLLRALM